MCCGVHHVVVCEVCLSVVCEMVLNDQHILHDWLLLNTHSYFHGHIINVHQVKRFCANDGLHRGYLRLGLEDAALFTIMDTHLHPLGHAQPPESLSQQAQCAVPALMAKVAVASIDGCLVLQPWNIFIAPLWHSPQVEEILLEPEVCLACSIDSSFCVGNVRLQILIQCAAVVFSSLQPLID